MSADAVQEIKKTEATKADMLLGQIEELDKSLIEYFPNTLVIDNALTRKLVSFQANKARTYYRWYKYKEAFSADLVEYLFFKYKVAKGKILDPFAGAGTALFVCSSLGYDSEGIELLPIGQKIIQANVLARGTNKQSIVAGLENWLLQQPWNTEGEIKSFEVLRITDGAYPEKTHYKIGRYLNELEGEPSKTKEILLFAMLCILESISYTRKDGQYLRWDYRSRRRNGKNPFDKGKILTFDEAIVEKLSEIKDDMNLGETNGDLFSFMRKDIQTGDVNLLEGSCLELLPQLKSGAYSGIITSPPILQSLRLYAHLCLRTCTAWG